MTEFQDKTVKMRGLASATRLCLSCSRTFEPGKFNMALSGTDATCPHDGSVLMPMPELDTPLVGNYLYKGLLGVGGMGVVFQALNPYLDRLVAIKFVKGKRYDSKQLTRFMQEGKLLAKLVHPNLVSVLDFGANDVGEPYMVMEYLDGQSLAQMIEKARTIPLDQTLEILIQTCKGLAHAHKFGAVHRDIKPSNIFISNKGRAEISVKLLDFGIAKLCFPEDPVSSADLTRTGEIFGSPLYMSPEQALSKTVDERSDIYNIGCVLYEMLSGSPPHVGKTAMETVFKHVSDDPEPLRQKVPKKNYPAILEELLICLLAKDPDDRIESVEKLEEIFIAIGEENSTYLREISRRAKQINSQSTIGSAANKRKPAPQVSALQFEFGTAAKMAVASIAVILAGAAAASYFIFRPAPKAGAPVVSETPDQKAVKDLDDNIGVNSLFDIADHPDSKSLEQYIKRNLQRGDPDFKLDRLPLNKDAFHQIVRYGGHIKSVNFRTLLGLTPENLEVLRALPLTGVTITFGDLTDDGLATIAKFPTLRSLALVETHDLSKRALVCLKDAHLYALHAEGFAISADSWKEFLPRPHYTTLEFFGSARSDMGEEMHIMPVKAAVPLIVKCPNLHALSLVSTDIDDSDVIQLCTVNGLQSLDISRNRKVSDVSVPALLKLHKLEQLDLCDTHMTTKGIEKIVRESNCKKIKVSIQHVRASRYLEQQATAGRVIL